jgi:hypothetical protein
MGKRCMVEFLSQSSVLSVQSSQLLSIVEVAEGLFGSARVAAGVVPR